jgi:hypothetical protein
MAGPLYRTRRRSFHRCFPSPSRGRYLLPDDEPPLLLPEVEPLPEEVPPPLLFPDVEPPPLAASEPASGAAVEATPPPQPTSGRARRSPHRGRARHRFILATYHRASRATFQGR